MSLASGLRPPARNLSGPGPLALDPPEPSGPCPLQLDQSHVGSLTLAERPQDPRRVLPVATLLAGAPGPASRSPTL